MGRIALSQMTTSQFMSLFNDELEVRDICYLISTQMA
jgi:hypothetical protein